MKSLSNSFAPYNLDDLDEILTWMRRATGENAENATGTISVVLCGISLGAISLGKYMSSRGCEIDTNVKGALMISGAFGMEFAEWWRYREIFQR